MSDYEKYVLADKNVEATLSSTGVLHVNSSSMLASPLVQDQLDASERIRKKQLEIAKLQQQQERSLAAGRDS